MGFLLLSSSLALGLFQDTAETLIDIDVREADVQDVLRLLAEVGGFNLAVDPGVSCKIDAQADAGPLAPGARAFTADLWPRAGAARGKSGPGRARRGDSQRVRSPAEVSGGESARRARSKRATFGSPTRKRATWRPILSKFLSPRGSVVFDERTNTLIVTDVRR